MTWDTFLGVSGRGYRNGGGSVVLQSETPTLPKEDSGREVGIRSNGRRTEGVGVTLPSCGGNPHCSYPYPLRTFGGGLSSRARQRYRRRSRLESEREGWRPTTLWLFSPTCPPWPTTSRDRHWRRTRGDGLFWKHISCTLTIITGNQLHLNNIFTKSFLSFPMMACTITP